MANAFVRGFDIDSGAIAAERERAKPRFWIEEVFHKPTDSLIPVEMVEIKVAGEDKNVWAGRVSDDHRRRFAEHYKAFKNNQTLPPDGTPLNKLTGMTHQLEEALKFMGLLTIEELANATEQACTQFMGGYTWRKKAQVYVTQNSAKVSLDTQKDNVIAQQSEMLARLQEQMAEMSAKMAAQTQAPVEKVKNKGGRPKKIADVQAAA